MAYEAVIGLEVHAEMQTASKMFCACAVVDATQSEPNISVCPVCTGMPGVLPVVNQQAVDYALRVALALECEIAHTSLFARKNYFYPDLPKGYQISQYEYPLAVNGRLRIETRAGERDIRIRRVHLEEDTGKLTHITRDSESYSLVDLNRAGIPLLEIVSEPDMHTVEEVRAYASALRSILRYLGVNSGDMQKGVIRFEANVSVRPAGSQELGTRVEIKNLNSFRALERSAAYQIEQQSAALERGVRVTQETLGWDDINGVTYSQRSKEEAHDYRYFPEPDLPPLVVEGEWIARVKASLPELPQARLDRFIHEYRLPGTHAQVLVDDLATADYFEAAVKAAVDVPPRMVALWITGELFAWMNASGERIQDLRVGPFELAELLKAVVNEEINPNTGKAVLAEMLKTGQPASQVIDTRGLRQISDLDEIQAKARAVIEAHPKELESYLAGKETLSHWFFGQVMREMGGKASPQGVREALERELAQRKL